MTEPLQTILAILLGATGLVAAFWTVYLIALVLASLRRRHTPPATSISRKRICALVPAHDEESQIADTVRSVFAAKSEQAELSVLVVADNCTDRTADCAQQAGADVIVRQDETRRGKGWALDFGLRHILKDESVDAVFIMDADSVVSADAFDRLSQWLSAGYDCVQIRYQVRNAEDNWRTTLMAAAFDLRTHVQAMGRQALGHSVGLLGNGMCFSRSLIERMHWPSRSITEDLEAAAYMVNQGDRIWYEPDAAVNADMPTRGDAAAIQRSRWEAGQLLCCLRWVPKLMVAGLRQVRVDPIAHALAMMNPPLALLVLVVLAAWLMAWLVGPLPASFLPGWFIWVWPGLVLLLSLYVVGGMVRCSSMSRIGHVLRAAPIYLLWKMWLYLSMPLRSGVLTWARTPRDEKGQTSGSAGSKASGSGRDGERSSPPSRTCLVISPVRDEAEYLQRTIDSMVAQTVRPTLWIIVDDGSSDDTPVIAGRAAAQHDWIRLHHRSDRGGRRVGGGVVEAFKEGLAQADLGNYAYVCKLDGDLEFEPVYFERLYERFEANPNLGTASGKSWIRVGSQLIPERTSDEFSQGQTKLYRMDCYEDIGGFVQQVMWDGIDCHRCRMRYWEARSFRDEDLRFIHLRPMGSSFKGILHGRLRWGRGQYFMGTHWLYAIGISVYRAVERPFLVGGLCILIGYLSGYVRRLPRYEDQDFRRHLHQWQMKRLRHLG